MDYHKQLQNANLLKVLTLVSKQRKFNRVLDTVEELEWQVDKGKEKKNEMIPKKSK